MYILEYDLENEKVKYLIKTDEKLGKLIKYVGNTQLIIEEDGFKCITNYIIGQQISDIVRETIYQRLCTTFNNITPENMLSASEEELRKIGLSSRKIEYIKILAQAIIDKKIDFEEFHKLTNTEIIKRLTVLKGIGEWTAEMYLIFSLCREDVLSEGDGTIKKAIQYLYDLKKTPTKAELEKYSTNWQKYATIVSAYFWKAGKMGLFKDIK